MLMLLLKWSGDYFSYLDKGWGGGGGMWEGGFVLLARPAFLPSVIAQFVHPKCPLEG